MAKPAAVTVRSTQYDAQKGCWEERGYFTVTPAITGVISTDTGVECTVDQNLSCNIGDAIFVNAQNLTAGLIPAGARVTAQGVVAVKLYNITGSTITDSTQTTYDYVLYHYS